MSTPNRLQKLRGAAQSLHVFHGVPHCCHHQNCRPYQACHGNQEGCQQEGPRRAQFKTRLGGGRKSSLGRPCHHCIPTLQMVSRSLLLAHDRGPLRRILSVAIASMGALRYPAYRRRGSIRHLLAHGTFRAKACHQVCAVSMTWLSSRTSEAASVKKSVLRTSLLLSSGGLCHRWALG